MRLTHMALRGFAFFGAVLLAVIASLALEDIGVTRDAARLFGTFIAGPLGFWVLVAKIQPPED